jgi:hypothetical protein
MLLFYVWIWFMTRGWQSSKRAELLPPSLQRSIHTLLEDEPQWDSYTRGGNYCPLSFSWRSWSYCRVDITILYVDSEADTNTAWCSYMGSEAILSGLGHIRKSQDQNLRPCQSAGPGIFLTRTSQTCVFLHMDMTPMFQGSFRPRTRAASLLMDRNSCVPWSVKEKKRLSDRWYSLLTAWVV